MTPPKWEYAIPSDTSRKYESGYSFLNTQFCEMKDEIARLRKHIVDLRETIKEISVDGTNGKA